MDNFLSGIYFICGILIILVVEFGSFTSDSLNINYDSKETKPFIKHSITILILLILINILLNLT